MGRRYKSSLRQEIVDMIVKQGLTFRDVSAQKNVPLGTIQAWVREHNRYSKTPQFSYSERLSTQEDLLEKAESTISDLQSDNAALLKVLIILTRKQPSLI